MVRGWSIAVATVLCVGVLSVGAASALDCDPHCGFTHDYGPYDFTYIQPGLYGYVVCARGGECWPYVAYSTSGYPRGRITIRPRPRRNVLR